MDGSEGDSEIAIGEDKDSVTEWDAGLPDADELMPLSQPLIPPELAYAFRILPEPGCTLVDVHRASRATVDTLFRPASSTADESPSSAAAKRPRLVWTPQLHKRFVDVVSHLGIKSAVPKTIMQLMNVEGLTRENVASHLQKYRLYVKRMQGGLSSEGPAPADSDHIFASTPVPPSIREAQVMMPYSSIYSAMTGNGNGNAQPMIVHVNGGGQHHQRASDFASPYGNGYNHLFGKGPAYVHHAGSADK